MSQSTMTSRNFFLLDEPKTLFPMSLSHIMIDIASDDLRDYIYGKVLDATKPEYSFLPQLRTYAAKARHHTRRTMRLDPVSEFYIYDFAYRNRSLFRRPFLSTRRHFGYRFEGGNLLGGVEAYADFQSSLATESYFYNHTLSFDLASYFNSIYHHDLVNWFAGQGAPDVEVAGISQFLREINSGRSVDCLPHGLYPCKMIGNGFLSFVDNSNRIKSAELLRFMDDIHLFDDDASVLLADFHRIQVLLGEKGLSLNSDKTTLPAEVAEDQSLKLDALKVDLLKKRRDLMSKYDVHENSNQPVVELSEKQKNYLLELLRSDELTEEDAELVLTLMWKIVVML